VPLPRIPVDADVPRTTTLAVQAAIIAAIPEDRRGAFLAAGLGVRPGEVRALNGGDYDRRTHVLTVRAAMKGQTSSAPRHGTEERNERRLIVDDELAGWIERATYLPQARSSARLGSALRREDPRREIWTPFGPRTEHNENQ
jgi:integrase